MAREKAKAVRLRMLRDRYAKTCGTPLEAEDLFGADDEKIAVALRNEIRSKGKTYSFGPTVARRLIQIGVAEPVRSEVAPDRDGGEDAEPVRAEEVAPDRDEAKGSKKK